MDRLVLADILELSSSADYGGRGLLQPSSAVLALSGALFLSDLSLWQGAGYKLTDGEIDTIKVMVAQLENDLIETGDMYPIDMVRLTASESQVILSATTTYVTFDEEDFDPQDMHSIETFPERMFAVRDGLHHITACVGWGNVIGGRRQITFLKRDVSMSQTIAIARVTAFDTTIVAPKFQVITTQDYLEAGDFIRLSVYQNSGVSIDLASHDKYPSIAMVRV